MFEPSPISNGRAKAEFPEGAHPNLVDWLSFRGQSMGEVRCCRHASTRKVALLVLSGGLV
jgi:hypothetical protein